MFLDYTTIYVKSGNGGKGMVSFRREKYVPKGGPDGGNGGNGGSVIIKASRNESTFRKFRFKHKFYASDGKPGGSKNKTGRNGKDEVIMVPIGTIIKDSNNNILADLAKDNQMYIAATGGRGGRGNASFATPTNRTPRFAEDGVKTSEIELKLELKLLADAGLVGFPNAGKSSFIRAISDAKPEVANYPFTTLQPHLGYVYGHYDKEFIVADIPGIIEEAHLGKGLGLRFLRHIERTNILIFVIDITHNVEDEFKKLTLELERYNSSLLRKKRAIVLNKIDLLENVDREKYSKFFPNENLFFISALKKKNLDEIIDWISLNLEKD